jgi:signal transduction histidine kinase
MDLETKFAPSFRKSTEIVTDEYKNLLNIPYLKGVLDALPYLSAILNQERQAIYVNQNILNFLGISDINDVLGERPGELFGCIHSNKMEGGCGTSENCRYCGAVNAILKAQVHRAKVVDECRISSVIDGKATNFDLQIIATPIEVNGQQYTILTLNDISSLKRKEVLEKIFFHDILNISFGLQGFIDLMQEMEDPAKIQQFLEQISRMVTRMNSEIQTQRDLVAAEKGDLAVKPSIINMCSFLPEVVQSIKHHESALGKEIIILGENSDFEFESDKILISRIIVNMIKNALEAEPEGGVIYITPRIVDQSVFVSVKNSAEIPMEVKMQIFQRSFSTKGVGRGIGTYSMKLLCNQYLKGDISFISNRLEGTVFTLRIPKVFPVK